MSQQPNITLTTNTPPVDVSRAPALLEESEEEKKNQAHRELAAALLRVQQYEYAATTTAPELGELLKNHGTDLRSVDLHKKLQGMKALAYHLTNAANKAMSVFARTARSAEGEDMTPLAQFEEQPRPLAPLSLIGKAEERMHAFEGAGEEDPRLTNDPFVTVSAPAVAEKPAPHPVARRRPKQKAAPEPEEEEDDELPLPVSAFSPVAQRRKKKKKKKKAEPEPEEEENHGPPPPLLAPAPIPLTSQKQQQAKKKRGRPRKNTDAADTQVKRKRGRPKKGDTQKKARTSTYNAGANIPSTLSCALGCGKSGPAMIQRRRHPDPPADWLEEGQTLEDKIICNACGKRLERLKNKRIKEEEAARQRREELRREASVLLGIERLGHYEEMEEEEMEEEDQ